MPYWFDSDDSTRHEDIGTVHANRDCHHLRSVQRVSGVLEVPEDASVCGTCGDPEPDDDGE